MITQQIEGYFFYVQGKQSERDRQRRSALSELRKLSQHLSDGAIQGTLQLLLGLAQLLPDGQVLGAVLFAFAAVDAVGGRSGIFPSRVQIT